MTVEKNEINNVPNKPTMKRKTLTIIFAAIIIAAIVLGGVVIAVYAGGNGDHTNADGFSYSVSGRSVTITDYTGDSTDITIPAKISGRRVVAIASDAFKQSKVQNVVFSSEFKELTIEKEAFANATSLIYVSMPEGLTEIGESAFYGCTALTHVDFPSTINKIGDSAFYGCSNLSYSNSFSSEKILCIPDSVEAIGKATFQDCRGLTTVYMSNKVEGIPEYAFYGCTSLNKVTANVVKDVANTLTIKTIGDYAFYNNRLTDYVITDVTTSIGDYAFAKNSYSADGIKSLTIPTSVKTIGDYAFSEITYLETITFEGTAEVTLGEGIFSNSPRINNVSLPTSQTIIPKLAFYDCVRLTSFTISRNITEIGDGAFGNIGTTTYSASSSSSSSITITVENGNRSFKVVDLEDYYYYSSSSATPTTKHHSVLMSYDGTEIISYIGAFNTDSCSSDRTNKAYKYFDYFQGTNFDSLNSIRAYAFVGTSLNYICIPRNVLKIGERFISDSSISHIYFRNNNCDLDEYAFAGNTNSMQIFVDNNDSGNINTQIEAIVDKDGKLDDNNTITITNTQEWDTSSVSQGN